ncbi:hypothetical protein CL645_03120 [bacterium]|nr:hypothetical protein [bacterium]
MNFDHRNSYRYPGKGHWFDFWNCRIVIPSEKKWFFIMPYVISTDSGLRKFFYSCSSFSDVECFEIFDDLKMSQDSANIRWQDNLFSSDLISISEKGKKWSFSIDSVCSDGTGKGSNLRAFNVREKLHLRSLPFIHRVPTMKGFANGYIDFLGNRFELKDAIVYQAKNHGPDFPESWNWLHANVMPQFPDSAFEIGLMPTADGDEGIFRWSNLSETDIYASFLGHDIYFESRDDSFDFFVKDKDKKIIIEGQAKHGSKKEIIFPSPKENNQAFFNPESFDGYVSGNYLGKFFESDFPALGSGFKKYHNIQMP